MGICLWISGKQEEAFEVLTEIKSNKFACYFLGKCYQELEEYEKALDYFERSKQANEEEFQIQVDIAETQRLSGDYQNALKLIQKLSKDMITKPVFTTSGHTALITLENMKRH